MLYYPHNTLQGGFMNKILSNPFNYSGGKHRYLGELFEVLPEVPFLKVCDMFLGGGDLSTHLPTSWEVSGYDIIPQLVEMHKAMQDGGITVKAVEDVIDKAGMNKTDEKAYNKFKAVYNWCREPLMLYALTCHSNTNRIRFNAKGEQNLAFGKRTFNKRMKAKLQDYIDRLGEREVFFYNKSSLEIDLSYYDLLLVDCPYLNTTACYNENGGWKVEDEILLHNKLHEAHKRGQKFAYFGQTTSNGVENIHLTEFAEKYNMKVLKDTTAHCSNNKKYKGVTKEVMIYNF